MQIAWSQTHKTRKKVTSFSFFSLPFFVLPLSLALLAGALVFFYVLYVGFSKKKIFQQRKLSRAECLISIVDILNGSLDSLRGKLKQVGRLLAHEGDLSQWRCRIVLGDDPMLLPPVGKKLGNHFPMEVEGQKVGTLIVTTPHLEFDEVDKPFFDTLARLLGIFVYRENMWIEFHSEIDRVQASLLLNLATTPDSLASADHPTVEHMLRMLGHLKGKVEFPLVNKL